ncbi:MAG: dNTP triphosphohydrolase [Schleiferiaceae bacterium]|nr:dNTP triphosphohydrolase [Schleiferiaceae bacterium]
MEWNRLYANQRTGEPLTTPGVDAPRTDFQRDFDRLIFSSPFRRLQNKTQVFPLPGSVFVHNRLTHSLEVASIGRTLGKLVGKALVERHIESFSVADADFYRFDLSNVVAAACLAHDIGNPAFGHSGEKALSQFFLDREADLKPHFSAAEWSDLIEFEGNANAIRVLTNAWQGRLEGGYRLTYPTIAAIAKYPCESTRTDKKRLAQKKYGFFQSEKETFVQIAQHLGMRQLSATPFMSFARHPFVFLVEAADDICYRIIDLEDAHRLGILSYDTVKELLFQLFSESEKEKVAANLTQMGDKNEEIAYLRSKSLNHLTNACANAFLENEHSLLSGTLEDSLIDLIADDLLQPLREIENISVKEIYNHPSVIEIEMAGFEVMNDLLSKVVPALVKSPEQRSSRDKKLFLLIPNQYKNGINAPTAYQRVQCGLDYVSGMTDLYAMEIYRKWKGIQVPGF